MNDVFYNVTQNFQKSYCYTNLDVRIRYHVVIYSVSQKTSPTFLAVTLESIIGFSQCSAHMLLRK